MEWYYISVTGWSFMILVFECGISLYMFWELECQLISVGRWSLKFKYWETEYQFITEGRRSIIIIVSGDGLSLYQCWERDFYYISLRDVVIIIMTLFFILYSWGWGVNSTFLPQRDIIHVTWNCYPVETVNFREVL